MLQNISFAANPAHRYIIEQLQIKQIVKDTHVLVSIISCIISVIALVINILYTHYTRASLEYEQRKDSFINTPAIKEEKDSIYVDFSMNNPSCELQAMTITFPDSVSKQQLHMDVKPFRLPLDELEMPVRTFFEKCGIQSLDSVDQVRIVKIPVMMDYSAIVYGSPHQLRENRLLLYQLHLHEDMVYAEYCNSYLVSRQGFPIKEQTYWFFSKTDEKVRQQDRKDVKAILNKQLNESMTHSKSR